MIFDYCRVLPEQESSKHSVSHLILDISQELKRQFLQKRAAVTEGKSFDCVLCSRSGDNTAETVESCPNFFASWLGEAADELLCVRAHIELLALLGLAGLEGDEVANQDIGENGEHLQHVLCHGQVFVATRSARWLRSLLWLQFNGVHETQE